MPSEWPDEYFWSKVDASGECWLWRGFITPAGYGRYSRGGQRYRAHRFAYQLVKGEIPKGLTLDHLCRTRHCVRPDHLEAVTSYENVMRGVGFAALNAAKTQCSKGHPYNHENTWTGYGRRYCKPCSLEKGRRYYAIKTAQGYVRIRGVGWVHRSGVVKVGQKFVALDKGASNDAVAGKVHSSRMAAGALIQAGEPSLDMGSDGSTRRPVANRKAATSTAVTA